LLEFIKIKEQFFRNNTKVICVLLGQLISSVLYIIIAFDRNGTINRLIADKKMGALYIIKNLIANF